MSALFHSYLCGRNAAEWLIKMSFVFYVALTCAVAIAAEVAVDWFSYTIPIWIHILCGVSSLLGYLAMYKTKNNNAINFFISLFLPLELKILLLALASDHYVQTAKWYLLIIEVIISLSLVIGYIIDRSHKRHLRPFSYIHDAQVLCCLILINFVAQVGFAAANKINDAMYFQATYEQQMEQQQVQLEQQEVKLPAVSLENHLDTFCVLLDTDRWSRMTETDKITVLNFVLQEEASYLGLPFELTLEYQAQIQNYEFCHHTISTYAFYSGQEHKVCISAAAIDDPKEAVHTICHETYHAYTETLTQCYMQISPAFQSLLAFRHVPNYLREYSDYKNCDGMEKLDEDQAVEMYQEYAAQALEQDAESYATEASERIFSELRELNSQGLS